jgi:hypothetical protein
MCLIIQEMGNIDATQNYYFQKKNLHSIYQRYSQISKKEEKIIEDFEENWESKKYLFLFNQIKKDE